MPDKDWLDAALKSANVNEKVETTDTKEETPDWLDAALQSTEVKKKSSSVSESSTEEPSSDSKQQKSQSSSVSPEQERRDRLKQEALDRKRGTSVSKQEETIQTNRVQELTGEKKQVTKQQALEQKKEEPKGLEEDAQLETEIKSDILAERSKLEAKQADKKLRVMKPEYQERVFNGYVDYVKSKGFTDEEIEKNANLWLEKQSSDNAKRDLQETLSSLNKVENVDRLAIMQPAKETFQEQVQFTPQKLIQAKDINFRNKVQPLAFKVAGFEEDDLKVIKNHTQLREKINAFNQKVALDKADLETGRKTESSITQKDLDKYNEDLASLVNAEQELNKVRGNNNALFDELGAVIEKETGEKVTQEYFTKPYKNDYMRLKDALEKATYKLDYVENERKKAVEKDRSGEAVLTLQKAQAFLKQKRMAEAEVLALSNAVFLNEDITYRNRPVESGSDAFVNSLADMFKGALAGAQDELGLSPITESKQAQILVNKLSEAGIDITDEFKGRAKPTFSTQFGEIGGTSLILGGKIYLATQSLNGVGALGEGIVGFKRLYDFYNKSKIFKNVVNGVSNGLAFEIASDKTSFAMGTGEYAAQQLFDAATNKFKPIKKLSQIAYKTFVGGTGIAFEEYAGDFFDNLTQSGFTQETLENTFGKTKEEGLEKLFLTYAMGAMSGTKEGLNIMIASYFQAKKKNLNAQTVKEMEEGLRAMGYTDEKINEYITTIRKDLIKNERVYPDGKGGILRAVNITAEQEMELRKKLNLKELTEEELNIERDLKSNLTTPATKDAPYQSEEDMDSDLRILKGEEINDAPVGVYGENTKTEEGIVTEVQEIVPSGTQLRVPVTQLTYDEVQEVKGDFDRGKSGAIDVWQNPETNEITVINGNKRVAMAVGSDVNSIDANFIQANSLEEAKAKGDLINAVQGSKDIKTAVELVKQDPTIVDNLDISKESKSKLLGLSNLNDNLLSKLDNSNQNIMAEIGKVEPNKQDAYLEFAETNKLNKDEVAQLVSDKDVENELKQFEVQFKNKKLFTAEKGNKAVDEKGNPIKVYHATRGEFEGNEFRLSAKGSWGEGVYFADSEKLAKSVVMNPDAQIIESIVLLKNPLIVTELEYNDLINKYGVEGSINRYLYMNGYDGAIRTGYRGGKEYFVLNSNQIQIINNNESKLASKIKLKAFNTKNNASVLNTMKATQFGKELLGEIAIEEVPEGYTEERAKEVELYSRVKQLSPTVNAIEEKYAKLVDEGIMKVSEASNRMNAEIKENLSTIEKEIGASKILKEAAKVSEALSSDKKTTSDVLRDMANKTDGLADSLEDKTFATLFGVEPLIAKYFLRALSKAFRTAANFTDAINKAIESLKKYDKFKNLSLSEQADVINRLSSQSQYLEEKNKLKNPKTREQQRLIKNSVSKKIEYLFKNKLNDVPTVKAIEKLAKANGVIEYKKFAQNLYVKLTGLQSTREAKAKKLDKMVDGLLTANPKSIKSVFYTLTDLISGDKANAVLFNNMIQERLKLGKALGNNTPKLNAQQITQLVNAFQKANLTNLSGIYDLSIAIDNIISKGERTVTVSIIKDLQGKVKKLIKKDTPLKQKELFSRLIAINSNTVHSIIPLRDALIGINEYLKSGNPIPNVKDLEFLANALEKQQEKFEAEKKEALDNSAWKQFKKANPGTTITKDEYLESVKPLEDEAKKEEAAQNREDNKDAKRKALEAITKVSVDGILNHIPASNTLSYVLEQFNSLVKMLQEVSLEELTDTQLKLINRLHAEITMFGSYSQIGTITQSLLGVQKAKKIKPLISSSFEKLNAFFKVNTITNSIMSLTTFFDKVFKGETGKEIGAILYGNINYNINRAKQSFKDFNKKLDKAVKDRLPASKNYDLGMKAYLLSSPKDLSIEEAEFLFRQKILKIQQDIESLKKAMNDSTLPKAKKRGAEERITQYEQSLNEISQYNTYEELVEAYNDGKLLDKKQSEVYSLVRGEYESQLDNLKASSTIYGNGDFIEENNYTSISYLKNPLSDSQTDEFEFEDHITLSKHINDKQTGTLIKRVNPATVGEGRILDFDFYNVTKSRVLENYIDMFTYGDKIQLISLLNSEDFKSAFKELNRTDLMNKLRDRIKSYVNNEINMQRRGIDIPSVYKDFAKSIIPKLKKTTLNTVGQVVKQPTVLAHTIARLGIFNFTDASFILAKNMMTEQGRRDIQSLLEGSDVSNRTPLGDEQIEKAIRGLGNRLGENEVMMFLNKIIKGGTKYTLNIGDIAMVNSDVFASQLTYITAMLHVMKKEGHKINSIKDMILHKNVKNTFIADRLHASINNESTPAKQGELFSLKNDNAGKSISNKTLKAFVQLFYMFQSHGANASYTASNSVYKLFSSNSTLNDRVNGLKNVVGYLSALYFFRLMGEYSGELFKMLYDKGTQGALGMGMPADEKEKEKKVKYDSVFEKEFQNRILINLVGDMLGGKLPANVRDFSVSFANKLVENNYKRKTGEEYEGHLPFSNDAKELSGVVSILISAFNETEEALFPTISKDNKETIMSNQDLLLLATSEAKAFGDKKNILDILYVTAMLRGYGEPASFLRRASKIAKKQEDELNKEQVTIPDALEILITKPLK